MTDIYQKTIDASAYWAAEDERRKIRQTKVIQLILGSIITIFLFRAISWQITPRIFSLSFALTVLTCSYFLATRKYYQFSIHIVITVLALASMVAVTTSGGVYTIAIGWLIMVPLIAGFLSGAKLAIIWSCILFTAIILLMIGETQGYLWPDLTPVAHQLSQMRLAVIGQLIALTAISVNFLNQFKEYEKRIKNHINDLGLQIEKREQAEHHANTANQAKTQFLANMSHQLRTPLNSVIGFSARLIRKSDHFSANEKDAISAINRNGNQLLRVVNELIELANLDSDGSELSLQQLDLGELINEIIELQNLEDGLTVARDFIPAPIHVDPNQMRHALNKLLRFICTESRDKNIRIALDSDHVNNIYNLSIVDNSSTADAEYLCSLFHIDNKAMVTSAANEHVSSLALVISATIIAKHQGTIVVTPHNESGICFTVQLPIMTMHL